MGLSGGAVKLLTLRRQSYVSAFGVRKYNENGEALCKTISEFNESHIPKRFSIAKLYLENVRESN